MVRKIILFLLMMGLSGAAEFSSMDSFRSKILTSAVSFYFNAQGYGKVENAVVDTTKKTLQFILLPEGETQKLLIGIGYYHIEKIEGEDTLILQKVQTNRLWLNRIFQDHMEDGIKIPLGAVSKGAGALLLNL